jgi:hypothetical protein
MVRRLRRSCRKIFRKPVQEIMLVLHSKFVLRSHNQAMGRTRICAQIAITTKGHVNVKLGHSQFDGGPVRRKNGQVFFRPFFRRHINAVNGTGPDALAATDTIFNLVKQAHPRTFREIPFLRRVLQRHRTREQVQIGDLHADQDGPNGLEDISKILLHETPLPSIPIKLPKPLGQ